MDAPGELPRARYSRGMNGDAFAILGLGRRFVLSPGEIEAAYLSRAAAVHPDLLGGDEDEAARASARLNDAKRVIEDPERRANALLELLGGPTKEQDKSLPPGFLMEIMETRQEIEAAEGDPARIAHWRAWASDQRDEYQKRVAALFDKAGPKPEPAALRAIRTELNAWRYIERLIEQIGGQ